jgi:ABC-type iron transport system FetAB permease component
MDPSPNTPAADLGWSHVGFGLTFIAFNSMISQALQLHLGASLVVAALRCIVQLTLVATILQYVFAAKNFWAVVGIASKYVCCSCSWWGSILIPFKFC